MGTDAKIVKLRCTSWQQLSQIYTRDLSRGAIFLRAQNPPPLGTPILIELALPSASTISLPGVVHELVPAGGLGGRGPGIDIKLSAIPQSAMWLIETALASHRGEPDASRAAAPTPGQDPSTEAGIDDGGHVVAAEAELLTALRAEHDALQRLNPFQVLGVGYEASDDEIRVAFADLTKRYHPDRYARFEASDVRRVAAEIFILLRDAYRKLGDEAGRNTVLASLGRAPKKASARGIPAPPGALTGQPDGKTPPRGIAASPPRTPTQAQPSPLAPRRPAPAANTPVRSIPIAPASLPPGHPAASASGNEFPRQPTPDPVPQAVNHEAPTRPVSVPPAPTRATPPSDPPRNVAPAPTSEAEALLDAGHHDRALELYRAQLRANPNLKSARAGVELCEGLKAIDARDRMEAAQRFEAALELDPTNERAARQLSEMRRQSTNERKGLLTRLMGKD